MGPCHFSHMETVENDENRGQVLNPLKPAPARAWPSWRRTMRLDLSGPLSRKRLVFSIQAFKTGPDKSKRGAPCRPRAQRRRWQSGGGRAGRRWRRCTPGVRLHCRFINRGNEYVSGSGMEWMSESTKRQCDQALCTPPPPQPSGPSTAGARALPPPQPRDQSGDTRTPQHRPAS